MDLFSPLQRTLLFYLWLWGGIPYHSQINLLPLPLDTWIWKDPMGVRNMVISPDSLVNCFSTILFPTIQSFQKWCLRGGVSTWSSPSSRCVVVSNHAQRIMGWDLWWWGRSRLHDPNSLAFPKVLHSSCVLPGVIYMCNYGGLEQSCWSTSDSMFSLSWDDTFTVGLL